jgi:hypothetical protein
LADALRIVAAKGGVDAYVVHSRNLKPTNWLVKAVGRETAVIVADALGSGWHHFPTLRAARQRAVIQKGMDAGMTPSVIALALGCDVRTVRRHLAELRAAIPRAAAGLVSHGR